MTDVPETLYLRCECGCGVLVVDYWENDNFGEFTMSIYKHKAYSGPMNWKMRFRIIWQIIRTGKMYHDELCLNKEDVYKLVDWIKLKDK